jgi:transcriptional regulator GlxA family with amidase domain
LQNGHHLEGTSMSKRLNPEQDWLPLAQQANWSVSKLAKLASVSTRTLERHFIKTLGKTPKAWLAEQRQKQALELLADGTSVKAVASQLGYQHASTFTREFKKLSGHCPNTLAATPMIKSMQPRNDA